MNTFMYGPSFFSGFTSCHFQFINELKEDENDNRKTWKLKTTYTELETTSVADET